MSKKRKHDKRSPISEAELKKLMRDLPESERAKIARLKQNFKKADMAHIPTEQATLAAIKKIRTSGDI